MDIQVTLWENSAYGNALAKGFVKIGGFVQINIVVYNGRNGLFIGFPSYKKQDGTYQETAGPVSKEAREAITAAVSKAYNNSSNSTPSYNVQEPPAPQYKGQAAKPKAESGGEGEEKGSEDKFGTPW